MSSFGKIGTISNPSKMFVCPNCDNYGCGDYVVEMECPICHYPLFSEDFIYMPNFKDAYDLAVLRSLKNKAKKLGFDDDDGSGPL